MNKVYLFALIIMLLSLKAVGQDTDTLSLNKKWYIPDAAVVQYAGNMGMFAVGPGYDLAKEKVAIDLLFGYVPKFQASKTGQLLTLKSTYKPFKVKLHDKYTLSPFQVGLGVSYHFGDQYSTTWQEPIPKGYYWWSTSWRVLGFAGATVNRTFESSFVKDVGFYAELGTYELVATAWFKDDKLRVWDIVSASVGVRTRF